MDNQMNQPGTRLGNLSSEETAGQRQSAAVLAVVFHKPNSSAGIFRFVDVSDNSFGNMMRREQTLYQEFLSKNSKLEKFISKVVIERGIVDHSSTYNLEDNFPVQVRANIEADDLTEAFCNPQKFYHVSFQNAGFDVIYLSTPTAPLSQRVVSFRTILDKTRLFLILVTAMLVSLLVAGGITALLSKSPQTVGIVIGVVMGLFSLLVAIATWLWKLN